MESHQTDPAHARLVLASGSAARRSLLEDAGLTIASCPVDIDEASFREMARRKGTEEEALALALAHAKALGFFRNHAFTSADFVIAADQILSCDGTGFDKPGSRAEARDQLARLRGRKHRLHTALVLYRDGKCLWEHVETPCLTMRRFSDAFLDAYLAREGDSVLSCVGAYRLEGMGVQLFERIAGAHDAVLGLPRLPLLSVLREYGVVEK